ncbi:class I SAM-dependent methyltransferase [Rahnella laticis]|uniref:class I SAM-dependent methyltransferase n=1 Tax=Rahnella laticis TaxID=2787622 RepID=UPI0018A2D057|nr:class I SAM-dependent methyltransferase [Rahnella laticis]MBF7997463.1 class I SAM-dependent methyltransferase [Rahnella laticis]
MEISNEKGARIYTPLILKLYDLWVLQISNNYAWRCHTDNILLRHFQINMAAKHLDIGVGTGYYIANIKDGSDNITLLDLNPNSLSAAAKRIGAHRISQVIQHDIFMPLPESEKGQYDSVSLYYLLHCLRGTMHEKARAIEHASQALTDRGTLHGATILGKGAEHNGFGRYLMTVYNKKGIFSNAADSLEDLRTELESYFDKVEIRQYGVVAVFTASLKKQTAPNNQNAEK